MAIIPIDFEEFTPGSITPTGSYDSNSNLNIGAKSSPFIEVKKDVNYTIQINYILDRLTNFSGAWAWGRVYAYDENFNPIFLILNYTEKLSSKIFFVSYKVQDNVKYIRFSTSHIAQEAVVVNMTSDETETKPETHGEKVVLRIHADGTLETFNKI